MPVSHCALDGCHAPPVGGKSVYCCPEHTRLGRNLANIRSRLATAERQALFDVLEGRAEPPAHVGFLTTTRGMVLTGQALVEFRAAAGALRAAATEADDIITNPGASGMAMRARVRAVAASANQAAAAVEKALRPK